LVWQGEQAEEIVARVRAEENKPRPERSTQRASEVSFQSKRKDTLATETKSPVKPQPTSGVVLVSPQNYVIPRAFSLTEPCSNNVAEHNALLIRIQIVDEIGVKNLETYGDSKLIVNQVHREYEVRHEDLVPYYSATIYMAEKFKNFFIDHIPRQQNAHADSLASLAASLTLPARTVEKILVYSHNLYCPRFAFEDHKSRQETVKSKKL